MTLDREMRKNRVLEAVVKAHIASAFPVGSKYIARILGLSSATIRNVMFELEKEGFIKQPYTSAGRVPTDRGYRRYVDSIEPFQKSTKSDIIRKTRQYVRRKRFFEEVIEGISHAISKITNYTAIALSPSDRLYFDGTYHMLEQPEFSRPSLARNFLRIMEEKEELLRIMHQDMEETKTVIHIGRENTFEELRECTIITATYRFKNHTSGNIGIIGPMRMRYEEIVPMVESFANLTTEALEEVT